MPAFDCLGDPVRRRILGPRIDGDRASGEVGAVTQEEFGIAQSRGARSTCGLPAVAIVRDLSADA